MKEIECNLEEKPVVEGPSEGVTSEVRAAIKDIKNRKASGPSFTMSELFKQAGETKVAEFHKIFRRIFNTGECPTE